MGGSEMVEYVVARISRGSTFGLDVKMKWDTLAHSSSRVGIDYRNIGLRLCVDTIRGLC